MDTIKEIEDIKARLDYIEAFLRGASEGEATPEMGPAYELLDLQIRKSESIIGPEYAYKLIVKNSSDVAIQFTGDIIFIDTNEFEVDRHPMGAFMVQAGDTHTESGKATITDENYVSRIADVTADIHPI